MIFTLALAFAAPPEAPAEDALPTRTYEELTVVERTMPLWPEDASTTQEERCVASVVLEASGIPTKITVAECPEAFHAATTTALEAWRWEAPREQVRTTIAVVYQPSKGQVRRAKRKAKRDQKWRDKAEAVRAEAADL